MIHGWMCNFPTPPGPHGLVGESRIGGAPLGDALARQHRACHSILTVPHSHSIISIRNAHPSSLLTPPADTLAESRAALCTSMREPHRSSQPQHPTNRLMGGRPYRCPSRPPSIAPRAQPSAPSLTTFQTHHCPPSIEPTAFLRPASCPP